MKRLLVLCFISLLASSLCGQGLGTRVTPADQASTQAQEAIDRLQAQLERRRSAPEGYDLFEGAGYRLLIPAPMELESRGYQTARLGSLGTRMLVIAGNPIAVDDSSNSKVLSAVDIFMRNEGIKYWIGAAPKTTIGKHSGWRIGASGNGFSGSGILVLGERRIIPIVCVNQQATLYSTDPRASYKEKRLALARALAQTADRRNTEAQCEQLYQSMELDEDEQPVPKPMETSDPAKVARSLAVLQQSPALAQTGQVSLGDLARQSRNAGKAELHFEDAGNSIPAGFRWLDLSYVCHGCNSIQVLFPDAATQPPDNDEPAVWSMLHGKAVIALFAGAVMQAAGTTSPRSIWSQRKFIVTHWGMHIPSDPVVTPLYEENTQVRGIPLKKTRVQVEESEGEILLGEAAEFQVERATVGVGCLVPSDHFGDFEPICAKMIDSFQVQ